MIKHGKQGKAGKKQKENLSKEEIQINVMLTMCNTYCIYYIVKCTCRPWLEYNILKVLLYITFFLKRFN